MYVEGTLSLNPKLEHLIWEHPTPQVKCRILVYFGGHIINKNPLCLCKSGAHFKKTHTLQEEGHFVLLEGILSRGTPHNGGSPKYKWPRSSVTVPSLAFWECPHLWVLTPSWGKWWWMHRLQKEHLLHASRWDIIHKFGIHDVLHYEWPCLKYFVWTQFFFIIF
jgi:hypothetical protein